ncbi:hypothetical protein MCETHM1_03709 [Flavobacteriaceae bacterium]
MFRKIKSTGFSGTFYFSLLDCNEKQTNNDISEIINADSNLKKDVENICTFPGVGILTVAINGFDLIQSSKQLSSYIGLDVKENRPEPL